MTSFAHPRYPNVNASTLAGVEQASELIDHVAAFFQGALRGGITMLLLVVLGVAAVLVHRIDVLSHGSHLIDLAAVVALATVAAVSTTLLPRRARR